MRRIRIAIPASVAMFFACSCLPVADDRPLSQEQIQPPVLLSVHPVSPYEVLASFNTDCSLIEESLLISPALALTSVQAKENTIQFTFSQQQTIGEEYLLEASVEDTYGNSMSFITRFFGYNPSVPDICINEFITQGSKNHPDVVELYVISDGNMAGVAIFEGTSEDWDQVFVFPGMQVTAGDYIVVHFKPDGTEEEINETAQKDVSGGKDATDTAFDVWVAGGSGLSGNNGVLTVYRSPKSRLIDGVLYSNRTSQSDENYRGFGTKKVMMRADYLAESGGWYFEGTYIAPEDAVNPEESTSTRSMCRDSSSTDTDSSSDWHIVPTGTASFGYINSDDVHDPDG